MAGTIKVVPADQAPTAAVAIAATATPQPTPHALPQQFFGDPAGVAAFRDIKGDNDGIVVELALDQPPPAQQSLVAFLLDPSGNSPYSLGALEVVDQAKARVEFVDPNGENLLNRFSRIIITQEPTAATYTNPSGQVLFEGELPAESLTAIQDLLVDGVALPQKQGYASRMRLQADEVFLHIQLITEAQQRGDIVAINRHAEHLYNLVSGSGDTQFGDLNGDGQAQNPGDGFGLLANGGQVGYLTATADAALAASNAPDATNAIKIHAGHVQVCTENMTEWSTEVQTIALELSQSTDVAALDSTISRLGGLGMALSVGIDVNGDGFITPVAGECGARVAHEHAQYMAGIGIYLLEP